MTRAAKASTAAAHGRAILTSHPDLELRFVQQRNTSTVHILVPVDPHHDTRHVRTGRVRVVDWMGWLREARYTLCGYRSRASFVAGKTSDLYVSEFPDERLCGRCHRSLGPHSARAFEHPTPPDRPTAD